MSVAERIRRKLESELSPSRLEIIDESSQHAGHASAPAGGESHFRLTITAGAFTKLGRIDRQRLVHQILAEELAGPVHALSITAKAPEETST